ncbi:hypothetical protein KKF91_21005 [Myxococcota bacterium]|nr:hypothetical protein [Myxococcota bacterium]MBU1433023.1 hypothetical protein [Myxococcota bacterium]MBU1899942.1 hypothetical protein [Myxococcota bacterium]
MRKLWLCVFLLQSVALSACDDDAPGGVAQDARVITRADIAPIPIYLDQGPLADAQVSDAAEGLDALMTADGGATDAAEPIDVATSIDTSPSPDQGPPAPDAAPIEPCPAPRDGRLGVRIIDLDGDPLLPNDRIRVEMEIMTDAPSAAPAWLGLQNLGVIIDPLSGALDGAPVLLPEDSPSYISVPLEAGIQPGLLSYEGHVHDAAQLAVVIGVLNLQDGRCPNPRAASGAFFQLLGRTGKTPVCVDLNDFSSIQIAPHVERKNTSSYDEANGRREDLIADDFIFCPESPKIVHSTEFCIGETAGTRVSLAGSYKGDDGWEVDDFMLLEILRANQLINAASTSQHHTGGSTFWCGDVGALMCESGCIATLYNTDSGDPIDVLTPVSESLSSPPRWQRDGEVRVDGLFPGDGQLFQLRATALDVGVEGTIQPALYLLIEPA